MNEEYGLVLEGGGFRGCYTAGAVKWLNDHNIHMPYTVTISAASCYGYNYIAQLDQENYNISVNGVTDKSVKGLKPLFNEGGIVGYFYLTKKFFLDSYQATLQKFKESKQVFEVGLFNMDKGQLEYFNNQDLDDKGLIITASCVLPCTGKMNVINGNKYLDGGIRTMVSIERSIATGHKKHLVIVTKDANYVRKPNNFFLSTLLKLMYHKYDMMLKTIDNRVDTYYHEMSMIAELEKQGQAILIRPSRDVGVKRFSGSKEQMNEMYNMGYQDMEDRKAEILSFLEVEQ